MDNSETITSQPHLGHETSHMTSEGPSSKAVIFAIILFVLGIAVAIISYLTSNWKKIVKVLSKWTGYNRRAIEHPSAREERAIQGVTPDPIPAPKFISVYKQRLKNKQLETEFKAIARHQEDHPSQAALRNVLLNNKQDVVSCDHSRVIVWEGFDVTGSDYYNASYIDGYNEPKEYIASQGPSSKTIASFWHMVWQEGVSCIVMATGLFENAVQQCDKYWVDHSRKHAQYGKIHVWHEKSTYLAQLNIRSFLLQKEGSCERRVLTHFEMVGLHEECPNSGLLLDVRRRVNALTAHSTGPVLVHCRCGGGRSAVYLAVDHCLQKLQAEDRVDVYGTVLHLRRFRKNMVRTVQQYQQIYDAIAMHVQCGVTVYPRHQLPDVFRLHYARRGEAKSHRLEREFQSLHTVVPKLSIGDCASGHRVENRSKSRDIMMLPPECARPYLTTADCGDGGTDFINAVYIDGYHAENTFLVTQWPMKRTIADVWRLFFDFKITSLVVMNEVVKFSRSYPRFWPKEINQVATYGPISVRYISCNRRPDLVIRTFAVRKIMNNLVGCELRQDEFIVKMFQVVGGSTAHGSCQRKSVRKKSQQNRQFKVDLHPEEPRRGSYDLDDLPLANRDDDRNQKSSGVGVESRSLLAVMEHVEDWQKRSGSRQPVCVMSKDGSSRVGLYCTTSICCDQLKTEKEIDVFNAVRYVRHNRPQMVPTLEEYRYLYRFMTEYILLSKSRPDIVITQPLPSIFSRPELEKATNTLTVMANSLHGGVYITNQPVQPPAIAHSGIKRENSFSETSKSQNAPARYAPKENDDNKYVNPGTYLTGNTRNELVPSANSIKTSAKLNGGCVERRGNGRVIATGLRQDQSNSSGIHSDWIDSSQEMMSARLSSQQPLSAASLLATAVNSRNEHGERNPSSRHHNMPPNSWLSNCVNDSPTLSDDIPPSSRASTSNSTPSAGVHTDKTSHPPMQTILNPQLQKCFLSPATYVHGTQLKKASSSSLCTNSSFHSCNSSLTEAFSRSAGYQTSSSPMSTPRAPSRQSPTSTAGLYDGGGGGGVGISFLSNGIYPLSEFGSSSSNRFASFTSLSSDLSGMQLPRTNHHETSASSYTPATDSTLIHASYASLDDSQGDSLEDRYSSLEWDDQTNSVNVVKLRGEANAKKESRFLGGKADLRSLFWSRAKVIPWPSPLTLVQKVKDYRSNRRDKLIMKK